MRFSGIYYRPQRSCGQGYVFTRVCDSVNGGVSGESPRTRQTPLDQGEPPPGTRQILLTGGMGVSRKPPRTKETPPPHLGTRQTPQDQGEPPRTRQTPPYQGEPPPGEEDCSIRSISGRYASYWNAFLS